MAPAIIHRVAARSAAMINVNHSSGLSSKYCLLCLHLYGMILLCSIYSIDMSNFATCTIDLACLLEGKRDFPSSYPCVFMAVEDDGR